MFDLNLVRNGDTFSGMVPTDPETNSEVREEVIFTLRGDFAVLVSVTWSTFTEAGLVGQSFRYNTAGYVLSRTAFPSQNLTGFAGEYAYQLQGHAAIFGETDRRAIIDIPSVTMREVGGFNQVNYEGSERRFDVIMAGDPLGVAEVSSTSIAGVPLDPKWFGGERR